MCDGPAGGWDVSVSSQEGYRFYSSEEEAVPQSACCCTVFLMEAVQTVCCPGGWDLSQCVSPFSTVPFAVFTTWVKSFLSCAVQLLQHAVTLSHGMLSVVVQVCELFSLRRESGPLQLRGDIVGSSSSGVQCEKKKKQNSHSRKSLAACHMTGQ